MVGKALLNLDPVTTHLFPCSSPAKAIATAWQDHGGAGCRSRPAASWPPRSTRRTTANFPGAPTTASASPRGTFTVPVDAIDEARFLHVMQRLANRLTTGIVLAASSSARR